MRNTILTLTALSLFSSASWAAEGNRTNKHEAAGVGSGVVVGAAVGGPIGAIVGAAIGGWFGDRFHQEKTARLDFQERYGTARSEAQKLADETKTLQARLQGDQQRIAELQQELRADELRFRAAIQQALDTQIFFRTGESAIHEDSIANVERMAQLIKTLDGFVVRLEGHADARGDEAYNEELSAARAAAVRDVLVAAGVAESRITTDAAGETHSLAGESDLDALAMERRVHVQLIGIGEPRQVARQ